MKVCKARFEILLFGITMRTEQEKFELIFDHLSGQAENSALVGELIKSDEQARAIYEGLHRTFSRLDCYDVNIPVGLADRTINHVNVSISDIYEDARSPSHTPEVTLHQQEYTRESRLMWVLGNFRDLFAVAACLFLVFLVGKPGLDYSRELSRQIQCKSQMAEMGSAFASYASDNEGQMPQVPQNEGGKWWNIGEEDPDGGSNTRHVYKMVRDGYIGPDRFLCPSKTDNSDIYAQVMAMTETQTRSFSDFQSKDHVNYSFKLIIPGQSQWGQRREAVAADKNPIFAEFDSKLHNVVSVPEGSMLRTVNSMNHNSGGQVVLFSDGSVLFMKDRYFGLQKDDIFTIRKAVEYFGTETPEKDDTFIAP